MLLLLDSRELYTVEKGTMESGSKISAWPLVVSVVVLVFVVLTAAPTDAATGRKVASCTHEHKQEIKSSLWVERLLKVFRSAEEHHSAEDNDPRCDHRHRSSVSSWTVRAVCIPRTADLLEQNEGRHRCAYNTTRGHRAVGVGYNLDDDPKTRRRELVALIADYDKVYKGKQCLNDLQISALLALDAKRVLDEAAEYVKALDDFCCNVMAVFADIVHSAGGETLGSREFTEFIAQASARNWKKAAEELRDTNWCKKFEKRCKVDEKLICNGCDSESVIEMVVA